MLKWKDVDFRIWKEQFFFQRRHRKISDIYIYIYIYMCVCVCVCVCGFGSVYFCLANSGQNSGQAARNLSMRFNDLTSHKF